MLPDRVSNPGPLTYESGALPIALRGPAAHLEVNGWTLRGVRFSIARLRGHATFGQSGPNAACI